MARGVPLLVLSVGAFAAGVVVAGGSGNREAVDRFAEAWSAADFDGMYAELSPAAKSQFSAEQFQRAYAGAQRTGTVTGVSTGETSGPVDGDDGEIVAVPVTMSTSAFGDVDGEIEVPVSDDGVEWRPDLVFPGLGPDQRLERNTKAPPRAAILSKDRTPLAEGPVDARTTNGSGGILTGDIGEAPAERAREMALQGFPEGLPSGTSGLELAFDGVLAGQPGGKLLAAGGDTGKEVLAQSKPVKGDPVRTTIDTKLQDAAVAALGDTFGGVAVLDADNGNVLALSGVAFSAPQPPGSTFKVITVTAGLEQGVTSLDKEYPVVSSASVGGYEISNAHGELCGGTLVVSFAKSCNTVFAPMGTEVGGDELVRYAELFGFNAAPTLYDEDALAAVQPEESTIPKKLSDDVEIGVSAIGQGQVLATPLSMASVAQTIANDGVRSPTAIVRDPELAGDYPDVEVTTPEVADEVEQMMVEVINSGTGVAAALPNDQVAGKTGTAELGTSDGEPIGGSEDEQDVDAWFTSYAPAKKPKIAVAVMVIDADADGGTVAAPIAKAVLEAGL